MGRMTPLRRIVSHGLFAACCCGVVVAQPVYNIPPDNFPQSAPAGTVINLLTGGDAGFQSTVRAGWRLNILGGSASGTIVESGAQVFMSAGAPTWLSVSEGGFAEITGGVLNRLDSYGMGHVKGGYVKEIITWPANGQAIVSGGAFNYLNSIGRPVELVGNEFYLNGSPLPNSPHLGESKVLSLVTGDVLSGRLADGNTFGQRFDRELNIRVTAAATAPQFADTIVVTNPSTLAAIGIGDQLTVATNGSLPEGFRAGRGSVLNVTGGYVGLNAHAIGARVDVSGGILSHGFHAFENSVVTIRNSGTAYEAWMSTGSTLNLQGGELGNLRAQPGSTSNISGGSLFDAFADERSSVNVSSGKISNMYVSGETQISGGVFERLRVTGSFANARISGGVFNQELRVDANGSLTLEGTDFRINGMPVAGLSNVADETQVLIPDFSVLSGVFADGSPFAFVNGNFDRFTQSIKLVQSQAAPAGPDLVVIPTDTAPNGARGGQTIVLKEGGVLPRGFTAVNGSIVRIEGGLVEGGFDAVGASVQVTGGVLETTRIFAGTAMSIGGSADWYTLTVGKDAELMVTGGVQRYQERLTAEPGSRIKVAGGKLEFITGTDAELEITGGQLAGGGAYGGSKLNISGGQAGYWTVGGAEANITGGVLTGLQINGSPTPARIDGGEIAGSLYVHSGGAAVIESGSVDQLSGQLITVRGGALGDAFDGTIEPFPTLHGYGFQIDGVPVANLGAVGASTTLSFAPGATSRLTGFLADGTAINFAPEVWRSDFNGGNGLSNSYRFVRSSTPAPVIRTVAAGEKLFGVRSGEQLVIGSGASLGRNAVVTSGANLTIDGGTVGDNLELAGGAAELRSGQIGAYLDVFSGGALTVRGGTIGERWEVAPGGRVVAEGGEFGRDGVVAGRMDMADGRTSFGLAVLSGGELNVTGGSVNDVVLRSGGRLNLSGGEVTSSMTIEGGAQAQLSGGKTFSIRNDSGGQVGIAGGLHYFSSSSNGSQTVISGGRFITDPDLYSNAVNMIEGSEFELNGVLVSGLNALGDQVTINSPSGQLFAGVLADGSPFAFTKSNPVRLRYRPASAAAPGVFDISSELPATQFRGGQTYNLLPGGKIGDDFTTARGNVINVRGGEIGANLVVLGALNVQAGQVGSVLKILQGGAIQISGGRTGLVTLSAGSAANVSGGWIASLDARNQAVTVTGGRIDQAQLSGGEISGGALVSISRQASSSSQLTFVGANFTLNGAAIAGLTTVGAQQSLALNSGNVLRGVLADGSPLIIDLAGPSRPGFGTIRLVRSIAPVASTQVYRVTRRQSSPRCESARRWCSVPVEI